jgi:chemotaxis response regulator CheB
MPFERLVVLGASAGGVEAVSAVASRLEPDFPAPVCVVVHTSPDFPSMLATLIARAGVLPAELASSGTPLVPGKIFVAPPDHHLLVEPGRLQTSRGPKENRSRPAVDPLFRSAAQVYGPMGLRGCGRSSSWAASPSSRTRSAPLRRQCPNTRCATWTSITVSRWPRSGRC